MRKEPASAATRDSPRGPPVTTGDKPTHPPSRESLIERVREGMLKPDEAEAEALRLKLAPLRGDPDPVRFDPMAEARWSLPMVVAWIAWRSPEAVREQWDEYRRACWMWSATRWTRGEGEPVYEGFELERRPPATWTLLKLAASDQRTDGSATREYANVGEARRDLWRALGEGQIVPDAIELATGKRTQIPAMAWSDLSWFEERETNVLRANALDKAGFTDVRLRSKDVIAAWPFERAAEPSALDDYRTGFPGRSSAKHLITRRFAERCARNELAPTLFGEADLLLEWFAVAHSDKPQPKAGTVANHIRAKYRESHPRK